MNKRNLIIGILLVVLLAAAVVAALNVKVEKTPSFTAYSSQDLVRYGRLHALAEFLKARGYEVKTMRLARQLKPMVGVGQVMFVSEVDWQAMRKQQEEGADGQEALWQQLNDWVRRGNHLVVAADENMPSSWLRSWGLKTQYLRDKDEEPKPSTAQQAKIEAVCRAHEARVAQQKYVLRQEPWSSQEAAKRLQDCLSENVHYLSSIRLPEHDEAIWTALQKGNLFFEILPQAKVLFADKTSLPNDLHNIVSLQVGEGQITVLNEMGIFATPFNVAAYQGANWLGNADSLANVDHAYLADYLVRNQHKVWLIDELEPDEQWLGGPAWWQWVRKQPAVATLLFASLVLLVWYLWVRVGRVRTLPEAPERYLRAHFLVQGQFLWRLQSRRTILQHLQQDLLSRLDQRYLLQQQDKAALVKLLAHEWRLPESSLQAWLEPLPQQISMKACLAMLRTHQHIMHHLNRQIID